MTRRGGQWRKEKGFAPDNISVSGAFDQRTPSVSVSIKNDTRFVRHNLFVGVELLRDNVRRPVYSVRVGIDRLGPSASIKRKIVLDVELLPRDTYTVRVFVQNDVGLRFASRDIATAVFGKKGSDFRIGDCYWEDRGAIVDSTGDLLRAHILQSEASLFCSYAGKDEVANILVDTYVGAPVGIPLKHSARGKFTTQGDRLAVRIPVVGRRGIYTAVLKIESNDGAREVVAIPYIVEGAPAYIVDVIHDAENYKGSDEAVVGTTVVDLSRNDGRDVQLVVQVFSMDTKDVCGTAFPILLRNVQKPVYQAVVQNVPIRKNCTNAFVVAMLRDGAGESWSLYANRSDDNMDDDHSTEIVGRSINTGDLNGENKSKSMKILGAAGVLLGIAVLLYWRLIGNGRGGLFKKFLRIIVLFGIFSGAVYSVQAFPPPSGVGTGYDTTSSYIAPSASPTYYVYGGPSGAAAWSPAGYAYLTNNDDGTCCKWSYNSPSYTSSTSSAPTAAVCGNGKKESGEQCDDGNNDYTDSCVKYCKSATCGDGYLWSGREQCDDGNRVNGDGCSDACTLERVAAQCGDAENVASCGRPSANLCAAGAASIPEYNPENISWEWTCGTQACSTKKRCGYTEVHP